MRVIGFSTILFFITILILLYTNTVSTQPNCFPYNITSYSVTVFYCYPMSKSCEEVKPFGNAGIDNSPNNWLVRYYYSERLSSIAIYNYYNPSVWLYFDFEVEIAFVNGVCSFNIIDTETANKINSLKNVTSSVQRFYGAVDDDDDTNHFYQRGKFDYVDVDFGIKYNINGSKYDLALDFFRSKDNSQGCNLDDYQYRLVVDPSRNGAFIVGEPQPNVFNLPEACEKVDDVVDFLKKKNLSHLLPSFSKNY
eukprot:TRINITY_DN499_c0_g1_i1.p1 TRINITY_DN499_c0_g1~~TRINITY_DN499_c0_g1_i1.p1  ORF type:complete len:251 (+),score=34.34 TRINITY_DN499_c0_g1_i1:76-828(+)